MQRKLVLWTVLIAWVSTFICAIWLTEIARSAMSQSHARNVKMLNQTLSAALSDKMVNGWNSEAGRVLQVLEKDPRVAFVTVDDAGGSPLQRHVIDPGAWATYQEWSQQRGQSGAVPTGHTVVLGKYGDLIVHRLPIFSSSVLPNGQGAVQGNGTGGLEGFVAVAVREPQLPGTLAMLRKTQLVAACVVCLIGLVIVVWAARRWTAPIRSLLEATERLGAGIEPAPVLVQTEDEMGLLAQSFNDMARNLFEAHRELERANSELEGQVRVRTAELEQVNKQLELEIRGKDEFLRAVTHDLNAPLRNVAGMAAMLTTKHKANIPADALHKIERIHENVKSQMDLINDLHEFSRARARTGRRQLVDLNELVSGLREGFGYELERAGIRMDMEDQLPAVVADRNRLRQVFQNLLDNAIKYTAGRGGGRITIRYTRRGDELHFSVMDTGAGISQDDLSTIFQVFRRSTSSGTHKIAGRGIGLAVVKSIVEYYGGRVWAQSKLGAGSTFHFTLDGQMVDPSSAATATKSA